MKISERGEVKVWAQEGNLRVLRPVVVLYAPYPALKIPTTDGYKFIAIHRLMVTAFPKTILRHSVNVTGKPVGGLDETD